MIRFSILLACAPVLAAQVHIGVTGGIPFNDFILNTSSGSRTSYSSVTSAPRRYTVGPLVEFRLRGPLNLQAGALYKRFGFDAVTSSGSFPGGPSTTVNFSTTGNSWEFPVLARVRLRLVRGMNGFVEAGPSFRHLSGITERGVRTVRTYFPLPGGTETTTYETGDPVGMDRRTSVGVAAGGGVEFHAGPVRLAPGLRFTWWDTERTSSMSAASRLGRTQAEALLAVTYDVAGGPEGRPARVPCCLEPGVLVGVPLLAAAEVNRSLLGEFQVIDAPTRRITAGALLEWRFHRRFSMEGSFLVRRFVRTESFIAPGFTSMDSLAGYVWEAPLMLKWRPVRIGRAALVVGAGPALRRASGIDWTTGSDGNRYNLDGSWLVRTAAGVAVSGGVEFRAGGARLRPELRYTRFEEPLYDFGTVRGRRSSLQLLLGVSWARRH